MNKTTYLVLLRGINVGGKNIIKMIELKKLFEKLRFTDVKTYIQSGNVIFKDYEKNRIKLKTKIEKILLTELKNKINIMILEFSEIREVIDKKPKGFGEDKENKYDVIYLMKPLKPKAALKWIKTRDGVDKIYTGRNILYISRLTKYIGKSYFSKMIKTPIYENITIRNWNTTKKLYELMKENN